jgi:hypothetical protein
MKNQTLKELEARDRTCRHDGDNKPYAGFAGNIYVNASSKVRPLVLDENRNPLVEADGKIYNGCVVNVLLDVWAQSSPQYGKRINATLLGVQFVRDDEPFSGGRGASPDDFDVIDSDIEIELA